MNDKEKKDFYIAMCKCCLIAETMKGCSLCRFNIGLLEQVKPVDPIPVSIPVPVNIFALAG
jgi:hypothetical protein